MRQRIVKEIGTVRDVDDIPALGEQAARGGSQKVRLAIADGAEPPQVMVGILSALDLLQYCLELRPPYEVEGPVLPSKCARDSVAEDGNGNQELAEGSARLVRCSPTSALICSRKCSAWSESVNGTHGFAHSERRMERDGDKREDWSEHFMFPQ